MKEPVSRSRRISLPVDAVENIYDTIESAVKSVKVAADYVNRNLTTIDYINDSPWLDYGTLIEMLVELNKQTACITRQIESKRAQQESLNWDSEVSRNLCSETTLDAAKMCKDRNKSLVAYLETLTQTDLVNCSIKKESSNRSLFSIVYDILKLTRSDEVDKKSSIQNIAPLGNGNKDVRADEKRNSHRSSFCVAALRYGRRKSHRARFCVAALGVTEQELDPTPDELHLFKMMSSTLNPEIAELNKNSKNKLAAEHNAGGNTIGLLSTEFLERFENRWRPPRRSVAETLGRDSDSVSSILLQCPLHSVSSMKSKKRLTLRTSTALDDIRSDADFGAVEHTDVKAAVRFKNSTESLESLDTHPDIESRQTDIGTTEHEILSELESSLHMSSEQNQDNNHNFGNERSERSSVTDVDSNVHAEYIENNEYNGRDQAIIHACNEILDDEADSGFLAFVEKMRKRGEYAEDDDISSVSLGSSTSSGISLSSSNTEFYDLTINVSEVNL